jgi:uncharacterized YigZ family protein
MVNEIDDSTRFCKSCGTELFFIERFKSNAKTAKTHELIVKKSRFIGYAGRVSSEDEAKAFIENIAKEHRKANHVAYAYVLSNTARSSDDGEPGGSAGLPIYNVISRRNMSNTIVVVVRYFGGTLLGKGGLIRAYGKAAGIAIESGITR